MVNEARRQAPEPTSDRTDDGISDPERNENDNGKNDSDGGSHDPMNSWEEFDTDAMYQKKHVDPEMRQWILTRDCW